MEERENIIRILREAKKAVEDKDTLKIKQLSDQTTHTASVYQDPDNIAVAVIVYSLGKITERTNYQTQKGWKTFYNNFITCIEKAKIAIEKKKLREFRRQIANIRKGMESLTPDFKKHIQDVFRKAQINKASKIYEHGISMEQTANLLGITLWELAEYSGSTNVGDVKENLTESQTSRIKNAMEMFR